MDAVLAHVREVKPYAIINCAAFTAVDKCETEEDLAFKINAIGPRNLAIAAADVDAKLIHVSTDYVFAGDAESPYYESDVPAPQSAYGRTKLAGEEFVKLFAKKFFIVRTAWLYGDGNNFVKTMLRLAETRDEVGVVADQFGSPTSALELAKAIVDLVPTDNYGIFHGTCEGMCSWADFAEKIFEKSGKDVKVKHLTTEEYPTPTKRPAYSVLENRMLKLTGGYTFAQWEEALDVYLKELLG